MTDSFFRRCLDDKVQLVIPDIVYAELCTGIFLASDPNSEVKIQSLLGVNGIEVRTKSLKIARRAGELYSKTLGKQNTSQRILPDFLIAAQAEATCQGFVTWNIADYENLGLKIPVLLPTHA